MLKKLYKILSRRDLTSKTQSNCKRESSCLLQENSQPNSVSRPRVTPKWSVSNPPRKLRGTMSRSLTHSFLRRIRSQPKVSLKWRRRLMRPTYRSWLTRGTQIRSVRIWSTCSSRLTKHLWVELVYPKRKLARCRFHSYISTRCYKGLEATVTFTLSTQHPWCQCLMMRKAMARINKLKWMVSSSSPSKIGNGGMNRIWRLLNAL